MKRSRWLLAVATFVAAAAAVSPGRAQGVADASVAGSGVRRFALVVGNNAPPSAQLARLRYADDDAVRWTLLLRTFGAEVELLTELDADSARLYGAAVPAHQPPSAAEVDAAMARLAARMKEARAAGARTTFYFVYAGHGDVDAGEGYVGLGETRFFRRDLESRVLAVSTADTNHVVVDACRSIFLATGRGPGGTRQPWPEPYFDAGAAARFPNTGFLLSSSAGGASHEWEEFQAGIFSHEVRSGLLGGADADGDGRVTYPELAAFVRVANQAVRNERFRPQILAQPPRAGDAVLVALGDGRTGRVHFGAGHAGRHVLEDGLGIRWADVHPSPAQDLTLLMPEDWGDGRALYLRRPADDREYRLERGGDVHLSALAALPLSTAKRGAAHDAFALLFSVPFDGRALTRELAPPIALALTAEPSREARKRPPAALRPLAIAAAAGGLAAGVASGWLAWSAANLRASSAHAPGEDLPGINAQIDTRNRWTLATAVTSGVFVATAVALYLWDRRARRAVAESP